MTGGYRCAVDQQCCETFSSLSTRERQKSLDPFRRLTAQPFATGGYQETDLRGFRAEVALIADRCVVSRHADHAAREIRLVELARVSFQFAFKMSRLAFL